MVHNKHACIRDAISKMSILIIIIKLCKVSSVIENIDMLNNYVHIYV